MLKTTKKALAVLLAISLFALSSDVFAIGQDYAKSQYYSFTVEEVTGFYPTYYHTYTYPFYYEYSSCQVHFTDYTAFEPDIAKWDGCNSSFQHYVGADYPVYHPGISYPGREGEDGYDYTYQYHVGVDYPVHYSGASCPEGGYNYTLLYYDYPFNVPATLSTIPPWVRITSGRPFGSAHDYGKVVFGNMVILQGPGAVNFHSEAGAAIAGSLIMQNLASIDFGKAHFGVGFQSQHHDPRLLIAGDLLHEGSALAWADVTAWYGNIVVGEDSLVQASHISTPQSFPNTHVGGPLGNWPTLWRADPSEISTFFANAYSDLTLLSDHFATVTTSKSGRVYVGSILESNNTWTPDTLPLPANVQDYDTFIFNIRVVDGVIRVPRFEFPAGFTGNYVVNVVNDNPASAPLRWSSCTVVYPTALCPHADGLKYAHRIIWNFVDSGPIVINRATGVATTVIGSILAPNADIYASQNPAGHIKGLLMINNITVLAGNGFEVHTACYVSVSGGDSSPGWSVPNLDASCNICGQAPCICHDLGSSFPEIELPLTGGFGVSTYTVAGFALAIAAIVIFFVKMMIIPMKIASYSDSKLKPV